MAIKGLFDEELAEGSEADALIAQQQEELANRLAESQEEYRLQQKIKGVMEEGKSFKHPSRLKYGVLFPLAAIVDVIDFAEFTGVGYFVAKIISVLCSVLIFTIFWFTGTKHQKARDYKDKTKNLLETAGKNTAHTARIVMRTEKIAQYVPGASGLVKFVLSAIANIVPVVDLLPWMVIGVYLSYRDEKKTYENARQVAEALTETIQ